MTLTLGWLLATSFLPAAPPPVPAAPKMAANAGRVAVWSDRGEDPYRRGEAARVSLRLTEPAYVAVFRVDTDGRIRALFPRDPWADTYLRDERELEETGSRSDRRFSDRRFVVDDDPGIGYLLAVASPDRLDFRALTRGDYWDFRLIEGGRVQRDPYVALADLAARLAPGRDYDYDIAPYYVEHRYDYPRFVCYDCHTYASYPEWNPYNASCTRYRVVVRDDPQYYPYRYGGRSGVAERRRHPAPRYEFRDVDPRRPYVTRDVPGRSRGDDVRDTGRTADDGTGRGAEADPDAVPYRRRERDLVSPKPPPRSTGEPELRRRRP